MRFLEFKGLAPLLEVLYAYSAATPQDVKSMKYSLKKEAFFTTAKLGLEKKSNHFHITTHIRNFLMYAIKKG